jgi:serine/threonine-protein kinase
VVNPAIPVELEAVIMKAMAKSPDDRYATADEFRDDLLRFNQGNPVVAGDPALTNVMAAVGATGVMAAGLTQTVPVSAAPGGPSPSELERKKRTRNLVILLVTLLVVLAVIAFFLLRSLGYIGGTQQVDVPNVVGQTQAVATSVLQRDGLAVGPVTTQINSQAAGIVLSTNPASGNKANKNSRVSLVVSAGPAVTVPNVVGKQLAAASQELQADKLRSNVVKYVSSNKPTGTVLTQSPVAPQMVKSGTVVNLTVSGTQSTTQVPNVIGISPAAAGSLLTSNNLTVGNQTSVCSGNAGSGLVAGQSPAAGTQVQPNTPVNLQVSTGPCTAVVPSVVGDTQAQATAAIGGVSGLSATPTSVDCTASGGTPGTVQSQTPTGGATVNTPATVTINVCAQPTTTTTTTAPTTTTGPTIPHIGNGNGNGNGNGP